MQPDGSTSSRTLECFSHGYCADLIAVEGGALCVRINQSGGSGYSGWYLFASGSTAPVDVLDARDADVAVGPDAAGTLGVAASAPGSFCASVGENNGSCRADRNVTEILDFDTSGTVSGTVAASGLTLRPQGSEVAVDDGGAVYVGRHPGTGAAAGRRGSRDGPRRRQRHPARGHRLNRPGTASAALRLLRGDSITAARRRPLPGPRVPGADHSRVVGSAVRSLPEPPSRRSRPGWRRVTHREFAPAVVHFTQLPDGYPRSPSV